MDLIEKLKAKYPELEKEPLMDELDAMFAEDDMDADEVPVMPEDDAADLDPVDMEFEDEDEEDELEAF